MRKVIAVNDGTQDFLVLSQIKRVIGEQYAVIKLWCGYEINSLESLNNVNKRIFLGNIVRDKFASSVLGDYSLKEGISAIGSGNTPNPPQKEDIPPSTINQG